MATKNWLIRTQHNQILGPVSKEKVIEFVQKGNLTDQDEVTSGNGYWFWIKEKDLVEKYLMGDVPQNFNPISEAPDVLSAPGSPDITASINRSPVAPKPAPAPEPVAAPVEAKVENDDLGDDENQVTLPTDSDLEYPDMPGVGASPTPPPETTEVAEAEPVEAKQPTASAPPKAVEAQVVAEPGVEGVLPTESDLEYPDMPGMAAAPSPAPAAEVDGDATGEIEVELDATGEIQISTPIEEELDIEEEEDEDIGATLESNEPILEEEEEEEEEPEIVEMKVPAKRKRKKSSRVVQTPARNDRYLMYIAVLILIIIGGVFYYYKNILNKPLPTVSDISFFSKAYAQEPQATLTKKKL